MFELFHIIYDFRDRITRPDPIVEFLIDSDVDKFIDCCAQHRTRSLSIKSCQNATPTAKLIRNGVRDMIKRFPSESVILQILNKFVFYNYLVFGYPTSAE